MKTKTIQAWLSTWLGRNEIPLWTLAVGVFTDAVLAFTYRGPGAAYLPWPGRA